MGGRMAGMALDDFLMPFAAMIATQQLMEAKKRKDQEKKLTQMGVPYNPLLMR